MRIPSVFLAGAVACCASVQAAMECPKWISVMPLHDEYAEQLAADAADLGNTTFIDGIAWSCPVNPEGDPVADRASIFAKRFCKTSSLLRAKSPVAQGILLQATMGHGGFPGSPTPWQLAVKKDGTSVYRMCPMDEQFLAYIAKTCRTFAELKPDFFMIDDDTRLVWDRVPGCFCPLHLAEFSKRTGREWTREDVAAMLAKGPSREAEMWTEVKIDSLRRFFRTIRENFGNDIPGILCCSWVTPHKEHASEFAQILAAPGQIPIIRGAGAPYWAGGKNPFSVVERRSAYAAEMALVGKDVVFLQECDTCPHTLWATSATRTLDHLVMLALEGCKGAKIWITRTGNYHEKKSAQTYRRIFRENRGLMEWATKVDFSQRGIVVPACGPSRLNFGDRYLALVGIPYRFGNARPGEVTALTADTLNVLPRDELDDILSGNVIADGSAALWLSKHGYSRDIGVDAKEWNRKTIQLHEFSDGSRQSGMRTDGVADLTAMDNGAKIHTKLLNRPRLGDNATYEAPGSVLFGNGRGGTILIFAQSLPTQTPSYDAAEFFSEGYKAEVIRWLTMLGGGLPGGVCYLGVGHVTCESGVTDAGVNVVVLNALDLDGDNAPEIKFEKFPTVIERLQGNGEWRPVAFENMDEGACKLRSPILTQRPAIFRWR